VAYRVRVTAEANRVIQSWRLPDVVMVEARLRFQQLENKPAERLIRAQEPFDGMVFYFEFIDPSNRLREYRFAFHVEYSQDEEQIIVVTGVCVPRFVGE
jgi:hypothetical protein